MVFGMKTKRNCVQIPFLLKVKYHGFWYEQKKELCPNPLFYKISVYCYLGWKMYPRIWNTETPKEDIYILGKLDCGIKAVDLCKKLIGVNQTYKHGKIE